MALRHALLRLLGLLQLLQGCCCWGLLPPVLLLLWLSCRCICVLKGTLRALQSCRIQLVRCCNAEAAAQHCCCMRAATARGGMCCCMTGGQRGGLQGLAAFDFSLLHITGH
jgi:hypothetical protein